MNIISVIIKIILMIFIALYPILPSFGKYNADLLIVLLLLLQLINIIFNKKERSTFIKSLIRLKNDFLMLSLIFFNAAMYVSVLIALNKNTALGYSIRFSMYLFIFYCITYNVRNKKYLTALINTLIITNLLISIITIYQTFFSISKGIFTTNTNTIFSTLENRNNLGAYLILSIFIVFSSIINSKNIRLKIFYSIVFIIQIASIISCQSRNALIAMVIGAFIMTLIYNKRYLIFSVILPIVLFIIPESRLRLLQIFDSTQNNSRIKLWETTLYMIKEHPILGIGFENYSLFYIEYIEKYPNLKVWYEYIAYHPHNAFLKFQAELGILGTITFILFLLSMFILLYKILKYSNNKETKTMVVGITSSSVAFQFMNLIDSFYTSPKIIITMLLILAFASSYYKLTE